MTTLLEHAKLFGEAFLDIFFPPHCAGCGTCLTAGILCETCAIQIEKVESPCCPRCGVTFHSEAGGDHVCGRCLLGAPSFTSTAAAFVYAGPIADGLRALKYGPRPERLSPLAKLWREASPKLPTVDIAVPVPLHPRKLRSRGFNQTVLLAKPLLRERGVPIEHGCLIRSRHGESQAGLKGAARRAAPKGLFMAPEKRLARLRDRRILVVDDVMTTGATADECAKVLIKAGAAEVHIAVMARAMVES